MTAAEMLDKARWVIRTEMGELQKLHDGIASPFTDSVARIQTTISNGKKVVVIGVGKCENIAIKIVATFNSTGTPAVNMSCQNALHGDLGVVAAGDLVLALSHSGETAEMLSLLPHLRRRGVEIITMTGKPESTLAQRSDIVIDTRAETEACPLQLAPTSSSTNMLVLGDALAMVLLDDRGFRKEDFAQLHPAGSLGNRLFTKVADIMRTGDSLAIVAPEDSVHAALVAMQKARAGAAIVCNAGGALAGVFTHGDFVRRYQENRDVADDPVLQHMSPTPITIRAEELAVSLLELLQKSPVDDVIVLGDGDTVVGLVDTQDLSRHKLV